MDDKLKILLCEDDENLGMLLREFLMAKGFNVDLMLEQHEEMNIVIGKEINVKEVKNICKEVFKNKQTIIRTVDLFNDSVNISVESITDEEKSELVIKLNEKYETELSVEGLSVYTVSNVRIRDLIRPYISPVVISVIVIVAYLIIRFRKMSVVKLLGKLFGIIILTEAVIASVIAISRMPVSATIVNLMTVVAVIELIFYISKTEKEYKNQE